MKYGGELQGSMAKGDSSGSALDLIAFRLGSHSTFFRWTAYCFRQRCEPYPRHPCHPNFAPCNTDVMRYCGYGLHFPRFRCVLNEDMDIGITVRNPQRTKEHVNRGDYIVVTVRFLAGGNMNGGISEGRRTRGSPAVSILVAKPALTRLARGRTKDGGGGRVSRKRFRGWRAEPSQRGEPIRYSDSGTG
jgi:hypothetical protein